MENDSISASVRQKYFTPAETTYTYRDKNGELKQKPIQILYPTDLMAMFLNKFFPYNNVKKNISPSTKVSTSNNNTQQPTTTNSNTTKHINYIYSPN